jgi:hypothetical protein
LADSGAFLYRMKLFNCAMSRVPKLSKDMPRILLFYSASFSFLIEISWDSLITFM